MLSNPFTEAEQRKADFDKKFEQRYQLQVTKGEIPLEFAGSKAKDLLKQYYDFGIASCIMQMLLEILTKKGGEKGDLIT